MDQNIQEIILKVLDGTASELDRKTLLEWIRFDEKNRKELEHFEGIWNALSAIGNREEFEPKKAHKEFMSEINSMELTHQRNRQKKRITYFLQIAAGLLLVMSLSYIVWDYKKVNKEKEEIVFFEINTPKGSHMQLLLPDSTKIWLNAESKLRCPNKFDGKTRTVFLEGEAFFEVTKDSTKPFIVKTSSVNVKALGTTFNVKAFPNEGSIETTLIEGSVVVEGNQHKTSFSSVRLLPNQRVTYVKTSGKLLLSDEEKVILKKEIVDLKSAKREKESVIVTEKVNTELYTSWIDNQLLFENETFESIAYKLERRYGATIVFRDDKIKAYRFSGKFPEISVDRALNALRFASPFEYKIKQDTIFIK